MAKIPTIPQLPQGLSQLMLRILALSVRIPLCLLAVFAAACIAVIGFLMVYKITILLLSCVMRIS
jgi:hypothetical protein